MIVMVARMKQKTIVFLIALSFVWFGLLFSYFFGHDGKYSNKHAKREA